MSGCAIVVAKTVVPAFVSSRLDYEICKSAGKPRSGDINMSHLQCKYQYKKAIKDAAELASLESNDYLYNTDTAAFWKAWRRRYCSRNVKPTGHLNGQVGADNID